MQLPVEIVQPAQHLSRNVSEVVLIAQTTCCSVPLDQILERPPIHHLEYCVHLGLLIERVMHRHEPARAQRMAFHDAQLRHYLVSLRLLENSHTLDRHERSSRHVLRLVHGAACATPKFLHHLEVGNRRNHELRNHRIVVSKFCGARMIRRMSLANWSEREPALWSYLEIRRLEGSRLGEHEGVHILLLECGCHGISLRET
mmetsp:Transcript_29513/g.66802  ORF Transcript_29513/g.66802 Transcript_29513/m.66802 type:complete len:201 (+) Transcript_29513:1074-1676(+)